MECSALYGMRVLYAEIDPDSRRALRHLRKAARTLTRRGIRQVLVPKGFSSWPHLAPWGLAPVDVSPLLRVLAAPLAVTELRRLGVRPKRGIVALDAGQSENDMCRAAQDLCPQVRQLVFPVGIRGQELANWLRREYGMPVAPPGERANVAVQFDAVRQLSAEVALDLTRADLCGMTVCAPELEAAASRDLPLLAALWLSGKLTKTSLDIEG